MVQIAFSWNIKKLKLLFDHSSYATRIANFFKSSVKLKRTLLISIRAFVDRRLFAVVSQSPEKARSEIVIYHCPIARKLPFCCRKDMASVNLLTARVPWASLLWFCWLFQSPKSAPEEHTEPFWDHFASLFAQRHFRGFTIHKAWWLTEQAWLITLHVSKKVSLLQGAFRGALTVAPLLNQLRIYVAYDNCIYRQDLLDLAYDNVEHGCAATNGAQTGQPPAVWHSLIVIVPLWLGGAKGFNSMYEPCIKAMLADDSCIGIIGGRPKHSMYFVGWQDDKLIYLDPHYCQEHVITKAKDFQLDVSWACLSLGLWFWKLVFI